MPRWEDLLDWPPLIKQEIDTDYSSDLQESQPAPDQPGYLNAVPPLGALKPFHLLLVSHFPV